MSVAPGSPVSVLSVADAEVAEWAAAQRELVLDLAEVAQRLGALGAWLGRAEGWGHRLALTEAAEISWWCGDRINSERLSLWAGMRLAGVQDDAQALVRAGWALRRLAGGPGPEMSGWRSGLGPFLGRQELRGQSALPELAALMERCEGLHPVVRAAVAFHGWRRAVDGPGGQVEAAVLAARIAAGSSGLVFAPLGLGVLPDGDAVVRLQGWLQGLGRAALAQMRHLERLEGWEADARARLADLSGRTPLRLVQVLVAWPMVSAPLAEAMSGAGRATVQRNLGLMERRGLIREVTGQGRYRLWTLRLGSGSA